jgi:excinuclease ABC subunit C
MKDNVDPKFPLAGQGLYPHFKLTAERFPRLLVTRRIENDGAEYFGPFLPDTGVRFLADALNRTFRLRACEIEIDGTFNVPCVQFYRRRCVAPCVRALADETRYSERVSLVRLFLRHDVAALENIYRDKITAAAEGLEFERAAETRDEWLTVERLLGSKDWNYRLDDAVDSLEVVETAREFYVYLVTMRRRKTLGRRVFAFDKSGTVNELLPAVIRQFYRFHLPKEIRVSHDFAERSTVADELREKFGRRPKITPFAENSPKVLTDRAIDRTRFGHELRRIGRRASAAEIAEELKRQFGLAKAPGRIEACDVAHISGSDFVAAEAVWLNGKFASREYSFWFSDEPSEPETLRRFVERRFSRTGENPPDLVLIDGGKTQLGAALKAVANLPTRNFPIIAAVKPPRRHGEISQFLTEDGRRITFDPESAAHLLLQTLRDEAHNLSNEIHRLRRETAHYYEPAAIFPSVGEDERQKLLKRFGSLKNLESVEKQDLVEMFPMETIEIILNDLRNYQQGTNPRVEPLIVPLRYTAEDGDAEDLRPLTDYRAATR